MQSSQLPLVWNTTWKKELRRLWHKEIDSFSSQLFLSLTPYKQKTERWAALQSMEERPKDAGEKACCLLMCHGGFTATGKCQFSELEESSGVPERRSRPKDSGTFRPLIQDIPKGPRIKGLL
jgi:hypothetical protein